MTRWHDDIWEMKGPNPDNKGHIAGIWYPHPKKKLTVEEKRSRNRIRVKNWYTKHGLHLKKVGRPSKEDNLNR